MRKHLLVGFLGMFGFVDAYNLNLRELMQTVESAHILAIATSLATEALCVGTVLDGKILLVEDDITVDICYRYLGGGDEIEVVNLAVIHLSLLVGQLTCAVTRGLVNNRRRHNLGVAGGTCLVEEEIDESSLKAGSHTDIYGETGSGDLHAKVEVDKVVFLCQLPVGQLSLTIFGIDCPVAHCVRTITFLKVALDNVIVLSSLSLRHFVVGDVWNLAE